MPESMLLTLLLNFVAYTLVFLFLLVKRVRIESFNAMAETARWGESST